MYRSILRMRNFKKAFPWAKNYTKNGFKTALEMNSHRKHMESFRKDVITKVCTNITENGRAVFSDKLCEIAMKENTNMDKAFYTTCSNEDLFILMTQYIGRTPIENETLHLLESELVNRIHTLSKGNLLVIADAFFLTGYEPRVYLLAMEEIFYLEWEKLNIKPPDILQLIFHIGVQRNYNSKLFTVIEQCILRNSSWFSRKQIELICQSYFVCNTSIKDIRVLDIIACKLLSGLTTSKWTTVIIFLKVLRQSGYENNLFYKKLEKELYHVLNGYLKSNFVAHICKFYASAKVVPNQLFDAIYALIDTGKLNISNARAKDLLYIITGFATANYKLPEKIISVAVSKWSDKTLMYDHPEAFVDFLTSLAIMKEYPKHLLSEALSQEFTEFLMKRPIRLHYQLKLLDCVASIDVPGYCGQRLCKKYLSVEPSTTVPDLLRAAHLKNGLIALVFILQVLFKDPRKVDVKFLLSYTTIPDIEIMTNRNGIPKVVKKRNANIKIRESDVPVNKFISTSIVSELMQSKRTGLNHYTSEMNKVQIFQPSDADGYKKITIKFFSFNQYLVNQPHLCGHHQLEIHLLNKMGYTVVAIPPTVGLQLNTMTMTEKTQFVLEHICNPLGIKTKKIDRDKIYTHKENI